MQWPQQTSSQISTWTSRTAGWVIPSQPSLLFRLAKIWRWKSSPMISLLWNSPWAFLAKCTSVLMTPSRSLSRGREHCPSPQPGSPWKAESASQFSVTTRSPLLDKKRDKMNKKFTQHERNRGTPTSSLHDLDHRVPSIESKLWFLSVCWLMAGHGQCPHGCISQSPTQINNLVRQPQRDKFLEILNQWSQCYSHMT